MEIAYLTTCFMLLSLLTYFSALKIEATRSLETSFDFRRTAVLYPRRLNSYKIIFYSIESGVSIRFYIHFSPKARPYHIYMFIIIMIVSRLRYRIRFVNIAAVGQTYALWIRPT